MTYGPDRRKGRQAWGASSRVRAAANSRSRAGYPIIVNTSQRAAKYPCKTSYDQSYESPATAQIRRGKEKRNRKGKERQRKQNIKLAYSTVKPKPKKAVSPPRAGAWSTRVVPGIPKFQLFCDRGDVPIYVGHGAKRFVQWKVDIGSIDYNHWLRENREPYSFMAHQGLTDLLNNGGSKILPVVPQLILPIKKALNTRERNTICKILKVIQAMVRAKFVGEALVPYYRQILPIFNLVLLLEKRTNLGDEIEYGQRNHDNLLDLVHETLELLEETGGEDAYINIKYMIPTYDSCIIR